MGFLKKLKAKLEDFLQFEEEWEACFSMSNSGVYLFSFVGQF